VFAHQPLFPVARISFSDPPFAHALREALAGCAVDAYFCGHTHNQALAFHPDYGQAGVLQVKTAAVGVPDSQPLPLEQTRTLLLPDRARYVSGFLEDTMPSWFLVEVEAEAVTLTWRRIGHGVESVLRWDQPADATWQQPPEPRPLPAVSDADLAQIRSARLHMAFHGSKQPGKTVLLNGTPVGEAPPGDSFAPRNFVKLRPEHLPLLRRENHIELQNEPAEPLCWGGVYLEAETIEGRRLRSTCGERVFVTGAWDDEDELGRAVERRRPGESLGPVIVSFATA
jgi:hypothetical protein